MLAVCVCVHFINMFIDGHIWELLLFSFGSISYTLDNSLSLIILNAAAPLVTIPNTLIMDRDKHSDIFLLLHINPFDFCFVF